ncbi:MAG TPA: S9 family peptidase, partial [Myxococcales bacterium]|nr:S9 family peptidase [Myxococcales bacterium]
MTPVIIAALLAARPFTPEELLQTRRAEDVQVSPDGRWVSVTVKQKNLENNHDDRDIWLLPLQAGQPRQFTRNGHTEHARWSPDGKRILAVREGQLWLYGLEGGDPVQLTHLSTGADGGIFSPDGRFIAFTSDVYPECAAGGAGSAGDGRSPQGGALDDACNKKRADDHEKSGVKARIIDHLFARHWTEWKEGKRTHILVMPASGGGGAGFAGDGRSPQGGALVARDVTPLDSDWPSWRLGGDDFRFTADGELIVSSKPAQREAWSTNGDLWLVGRDGSAPKNLTSDNTGDDAQPKPSPDGRWLAWTAQARDGYESDQWKLKIKDLRTGHVTLVAFDDDVGSIAWRRDSKGLVASTVHAARVFLEAVSPDGKHHRFAEAAAGDDFDLAPDGTAVVVNAGITHPPEVFTLKPGAGELSRLSHFNDAQYAQLDLGTIREIQVEAKDGAKVHSWIVKPANAPAKLPLLVLVHGGPEGSWEDGWTMRWNAAVFAARGYVVLMTDFHGSAGYGQPFKESIVGDWGGLPFDDIMRATDAAEKLPDVETGRTCAAGASYGGYMIDWIAGHTDRFRALVSHDGVYDLAASYGSTEELWFPEWEFHGPPWANREEYLKWSPSSYAQNFKSPTLVVQGELDFRVGAEQGMGMFTALQRRGVESRLLWFPDEGHWVLKPRNSQLWYHTVLDWISSHDKAVT